MKYKICVVLINENLFINYEILQILTYDRRIFCNIIITQLYSCIRFNRNK